MNLKSHISLCIKGDRKAQKSFYLQYISLVKNIAYRYTLDNNNALDVLQNSFIKIFQNLHKYDPQKGHIKSWIAKITVNESLKFIKQIKNNIDPIDSIENSLEHDDFLNDLEFKDLMEIINKLPPIYKTVFMMKEVEGYSHKEIAELMKIQTSSSRTILTRSKRMLRKLVINTYNVI